jgi:hypothetical protein
MAGPLCGAAPVRCPAPRECRPGDRRRVERIVAQLQLAGLPIEEGLLDAAHVGHLQRLGDVLEVVAREKGQHHQVGPIFDPLGPKPEQLLIRAPAAHPGIDHLVAEAGTGVGVEPGFQDLAEGLLQRHAQALDVGVAQQEDAPHARGLIVAGPLHIAQALAVDRHLDVVLVVRIEPASGRAGLQRPAGLRIGAPEMAGRADRRRQVQDAGQPLKQQQCGGQAEQGHPRAGHQATHTQFQLFRNHSGYCSAFRAIGENQAPRMFDRRRRGRV